MKLSEEQLTIIQRCGAAFSKLSETSRLVGLPFDYLKVQMLDPQSEVYQAYYMGLENTKLLLKENIIAIAQQGSAPAQLQALALLKDAEIELDD
ncbi:MAG: hypothetical protein PF450_07185 [Bacteroidales bacterium]|jgi:hypothetical protein|nr:hypothetical protein [Bacteroidales bacterium]